MMLKHVQFRRCIMQGKSYMLKIVIKIAKSKTKENASKGRDYLHCKKRLA